MPLEYHCCGHTYRYHECFICVLSSTTLLLSSGDPHQSPTDWFQMPHDSSALVKPEQTKTQSTLGNYFSLLSSLSSSSNKSSVGGKGSNTISTSNGGSSRGNSNMKTTASLSPSSSLPSPPSFVWSPTDREEVEESTGPAGGRGGGRKRGGERGGAKGGLLEEESAASSSVMKTLLRALVK
jgi:hypothetical protein